MAKITLTKSDDEAQIEMKKLLLSMIESKELVLTQIDITKRGTRTHVAIKGHSDKSSLLRK